MAPVPGWLGILLLPSYVYKGLAYLILHYYAMQSCCSWLF